MIVLIIEQYDFNVSGYAQKLKITLSKCYFISKTKWYLQYLL